MIQEIMMSQVLALIQVGYDTKSIWCAGNYITTHETADVEQFAQHFITLCWKGKFICDKDYRLHMSLSDIRKPYYLADPVKDRRYYEPIFKAYYFEGDNCNDYSQFIYELIGNKIAIVDDIRIAGSNYGKQYRNNRHFNLLDVKHQDVSIDIVNRRGRWENT